MCVIAWIIQVLSVAKCKLFVKCEFKFGAVTMRHRSSVGLSLDFGRQVIGRHTWLQSSKKSKADRQSQLGSLWSLVDDLMAGSRPFMR